MTDDIYMIAIVVLLPITAGMVLFQTNPYHALVIRGILGALAALVYALFGAADVALTEALVGTMLSITLYAIAVRSSMRMRLGIYQLEESTEKSQSVKAIQTALNPHHLSLEVVSFSSIPDLKAALQNKDLHGILLPLASEQASPPTYDLYLRIQRLADILKPQLPDEISSLRMTDPDTFSSATETITLKPGVEL